MDLTLSPDEEAFRDELRTWLEENHPGEEPKGDEEEAFAFRREWQTKLHENGWAGVSWPKEYGGRGASLIEQAIYSAEMVRARAPSPANVLGLAMGGPTVIGHGTEEQKERFIQPILSGEEIWCQGFSEPESGSDLASLKTKAVKDNGDWVVTGQKVWTTFAHHSKWCMLVARTDPDVPKHKGLTYFLMDMEQDAVQVRPLAPDHRPGRVQRALPGGGAHPRRERDRRRRQRLDGRDHHADERALGPRVRRDGAGPARPQRPDRARARARARRGPRHAPAARAAPHGGRGAADQRLPRPHRDHEDGPARARGLAGKWALVRHQPVAHRGGDGDPRRRGAADRRGVDLPLPARARELDRGRHHRDPQEHRRRARPWPAQARDELRLHRRPALDQEHREGVPRRALQAGEAARARGGGRVRRRDLERDARARLGRHLRRRGPTRARASASSSSRS